VRHRVAVIVNATLPFGVRAGITLQALSAAPYTITTGLDENGEGIFNSRPAGVGRNGARGAPQFNGTVRLTKSVAIGSARGTAGGMSSGRGDVPSGPASGNGTTRFRVDLYAQLTNPFNHVNDNTFVGNQLSPFFGRATAAGPARRVEFGMALTF
jgi:hypothetical protein